MDRMKKVSVVIPAYNHSSYLKSAIESVLNSNYQNIEAIVLDDGSTDDTRIISEGFKEVKYCFQQNQGAHSALNKGIALSTGDFISILNDDDLFHPDHIARGVANLETFGNDLYVASPKIFGNGPKVEIMQNHLVHSAREIAMNGPTRALFRTNWSTSTSAYIFRKNLWSQIGGFRPYRMCHDLDFLLRALFDGRSSMGFSHSPSWDYRCHENNTGSHISMNIQNAEILYCLSSVYSTTKDSANYSAFLNSVGYGIKPHLIAYAFNSRPWELERDLSTTESIHHWINNFTNYSNTLEH